MKYFTSRLLVTALFCTALLLGFISTASAQLPAGFVEIQGKRPAVSPLEDRGGCFMVDGGIINEARLKTMTERKECAEEIKALSLDLKKETLIGYRVGGDCRMRVRHKLFRNDDQKKLLLVVNNIYGGCRAGGSRKGWIVLDKLPADYTLDIEVVRVDDRMPGEPGEFTGEFVLPKQPSNIPLEPLASREIDVKGCLELRGQSQWILSKDEFLNDALERAENKKDCREHFQGLAIDFSRYSLAGYNLGTGHCYAPPVQTRIYNDAGENRYVIDFEYEKPRGYCHVLTYHPVWVLVPRVSEMYSYEFRQNGKKI